MNRHWRPSQATELGCPSLFWIQTCKSSIGIIFVGCTSGMLIVNHSHGYTESAACFTRSIVCLFLETTLWALAFSLSAGTLVRLAQSHSTSLSRVSSTTLMSSTYLHRAHSLTPAESSLLMKIRAHLSITAQAMMLVSRGRQRVP